MAVNLSSRTRGAAADYLGNSHHYPREKSLCKVSLLNSANEIAYEQCGRPPVM